MGELGTGVWILGSLWLDLSLPASVGSGFIMQSDTMNPKLYISRRSVSSD